MIYLFGTIAFLMPIFFIVRRQTVDDKQTLFLKCMSTFLIVYLSLVNYIEFHGDTTYFAITISGLIMCLIGDFLLGYCHVLGKPHKLYNKIRAAGMLIFMLAHFFFIVNYAIHIENFVWYYIFIPIAVALTMFAFAPMAGFKWPHKALAVISLFYMLTICIMLFFGLYYAIPVLQGTSPRNMVRGSLVIIASVLFFSSDTMLGFMYFGGKKGTPISIANLTTYYLSLICLALAF